MTSMRLNRIISTGIILSFIAGFADSSTFVGAEGLFLAHIARLSHLLLSFEATMVRTLLSLQKSSSGLCTDRFTYIIHQ
jgi:uncharacterized membrane protein YoaK (UPF0700 family)